MKILVINPGSTTTKVALFEDLELLKEKKSTTDKERQRTGRSGTSSPCGSARSRISPGRRSGPSSLDVMVARGGMLPPVRHGACIIDETMVKTLLDCRPNSTHQPRWGIAWQLARENQTPAFIYDSVSVDELTPWPACPVSRAMTGEVSAIFSIPGLSRVKCGPGGFNLEEVNVIVAHLGEGSR